MLQKVFEITIYKLETFDWKIEYMWDSDFEKKIDDWTKLNRPFEIKPPLT
jgi:hypothetical protein